MDKKGLNQYSNNKKDIVDKDNLPMEGKLLSRWEIYFYTIMGNIYYWINVNLSKKNNTNQKTPNSENLVHQSSYNHSIKQNYKMDIIKDISGEDIARNVELMKHIADIPLNKEIISAAKEGFPLIRLGDGSKPRVMITAGVHGNELPPQIAALNIIKDLMEINLQGTVYIIPFIDPKASAENSKLSEGRNLNLVADVPGSPTNLVLNLAQKLEINSLADFHSTSTHPAEDSVIYYPSVKSSRIAVYVNKETKSRLLALIKNSWTLVALCNSHKIPSILCEAESPDGIASKESIEVSHNQMMAFLQYHGVL